jgi:hypothetical protein
MGMSSTPSSSATTQTSSPPRVVPLGRLLIARGLLTEEQLVEGLLEQDRTGDRLGQVLINLGFVEPPTIAMALASQHGGPLKTEYGFAIGFNEPTEPVTEGQSAEAELIDALENGAAASPPPVAPAPGGPTGSEVAPEQPSTADAAAGPAPTAALAQLDAAQMRIAGLEGELVAAREQLDERRSKIAELEDQIAAARHAAQAELDAAHTRIAGLERELGAARDQLDERRSKIAELEDQAASSRLAGEEELVSAQGRVADLETEVARTREQLDEGRSKTAELEEKVASSRHAAETALAALREVAEALA